MINIRRSAVRLRAICCIIGLTGVLTSTMDVNGQCTSSPDPLPNGVVENRVTCSFDFTRDAAVSFDGNGRFAVVWVAPRGPFIGGGNHIYIRRFQSDGEAAGDAVSLTNQDEFSISDDHRTPSIDVSPGGFMNIAWVGKRPDLFVIRRDTLNGVFLEFDFDEDLYVPTIGSTASRNEAMPSAGVSDEEENLAAVSWSRGEETELVSRGLKYMVSDEIPETIRTCDQSPGDFCFLDRWESNVAMRSDGLFIIVWADAEQPESSVTPFNIRLQAYDLDGVEIGSEIIVNNIEVEAEDSTQESPGIAVDDAGNIVVVWTGRALDGCEPSQRNVFGRRLFWDGATTPEFAGPVFQVNQDAFLVPPNGVETNPTVALAQSTDPDYCGRFVVAWNGRYVTSPIIITEIRAQYFDSAGRPIAHEFRMNQATDDTEPDLANARMLANSGQHTIDYGPDGQVIAVWHSLDVFNDPIDVNFTLLPSGYPEALALADGDCLKGDVNLDELVDGRDIQPFIDLLLDGTASCLPVTAFCPADNDCDSDVDLQDVPPFVAVLLGNEGCTGFVGVSGDCTAGAGIQALTDCNENGIRDDVDIFFYDGDPDHCDCNGNGIPDECDIANEVSEDANENSIPDECEPDCNGNEVPDDIDIADETSNDCDANGVPDECDQDCDGDETPDACETLIDCNNNEIFDACEPDCDNDGVPDACELSGNDCNENNFPDNCEMALPPPFNLPDCNDNNIPDECDIADCDSDPACGDCNENSIPDGCDIALSVSEDTNENGIPDECETESLIGGGESFSSSEMTEEEAWTAYFEWCFETDFGEMTNADIFAALLAKRIELGLPVSQQWPE